MENIKFKPTFLYIKTHKITGLKYFGKTVNKNPEKYKGSGVYWLRHLEKHGNFVTTEIYGFYTDREMCLRDALEFSEENDIANSPEWANLIPETIDTVDGIVLTEKNIYGKNGQSGYGLENLMHPKEVMELLKQRGEYEQYCKNMSDLVKREIASGKRKNTFKTNNPLKDPNIKKRHSESLKRINHQQKEKNSQYGTCWITNQDKSKHFKVKKDLINEYYEQGWFIGRLKLSMAPH